jgi:predicted Zn-dependent peptidase
MITIKQAIEGRGGSFNGFTSEENTCYLVKVLAKDAGLGVDILSDMVLNPKLDEKEIAKEKSVIIEEINMYKDIPSHHVHEILAEMMWPGQSLGMPLAGTPESVSAITRAELVSYKEDYYNPANMLVIACGRADEAGLLAEAEKHLGKARRGSPSKYSKSDSTQNRPRAEVKPKDTEQIHMALGLHTVDRFHPDKHAVSVINIILGANMSSRLFHIVRDEMGLCYEISSSVRRYEDSGAFTVSAGVDEKKLLRALDVILKELSRLGRDAVTDDELARAKEYYKGQLLFALEDTMSHMLWLGEKVISGEKDISVKDILAKIDSVTPADIIRVSGELFKSENLNLAVIGPVSDAKKVTEALRF